jgi:hypothetical protein
VVITFGQDEDDEGGVEKEIRNEEETKRREDVGKTTSAANG